MASSTRQPSVNPNPATRPAQAVLSGSDKRLEKREKELRVLSCRFVRALVQSKFERET